MVVFLGFYAAAELSHFVEIVPRVPVSAVKIVRWYLRYGLFVGNRDEKEMREKKKTGRTEGPKGIQGYPWKDQARFLPCSYALYGAGCGRSGEWDNGRASRRVVYWAQPSWISKQLHRVLCSPNLYSLRRDLVVASLLRARYCSRNIAVAVVAYCTYYHHTSITTPNYFQ